MTVSVAMATYNGENFLRQQLDSIMNQTCLPDEIVICDDCSKDNTIQIIRKYEEEYNQIKWKIVLNETNQGYIKNFFKVIKYTTGQIIVLCDQDDVWDRGKIQFIVDSFENHKDMLSIHTDYSIIDIDGNTIGEHKIGYQKELVKYSVQEFCKRLNYCGMSSAFHSSLKDILMNINPGSIPTHDWTIHALSIVRDGMYVSNRITSYRRYTGNNVALNIYEKTKREGLAQRVSVVREYYEYYALLYSFAENVCSTKKLKHIDQLKRIQEKRLNYLESRNFIKWILNLIHIGKYPSDKAYVCDGLYIIGIF